MARKWHVSVTFKWFDLWVGFYLDLPGKALYVCLVPMLPIKVWYTEHEKCPKCGASMDRIAVDTGDGWWLAWECDQAPGDHFVDIDWPFKDGHKTGAELLRLGYAVQ